jgi:ATP-dependent Clp protease protease subunit
MAGNKKFWNMEKKGDTGELMLYGDISSSTWWGDEVTPKDFKKDLDDLGEIENLNIFINSGGGDVFAGQSIHSMLKRHSAYKTVYIDGLAASIASVIAMAGDKIIMPKNAMMMIHNAWTRAAGNANDFREIAERMDKIDESIRVTYTDKTGTEEDEIIDLMDAETWFTAEEAVEKGFADEIEEEKLVAASIDGGFLVLGKEKFDLERYRNKPEIEPVKPPEEPTPEDPKGKLDDDDRGESQPVSDMKEQRSYLSSLRKKISNYEGEC